MRFGNSIPKQKEYSRQERTGIRKNERNFRIENHSSIVFLADILLFTAALVTIIINFGDNIHYVWTIKIKSFGNKHSNATY